MDEETAPRERKIRRGIVIFSSFQVALGALIIAMSFTAFASTSSAKIRVASPYWAGLEDLLIIYCLYCILLYILYILYILTKYSAPEELAIKAKTFVQNECYLMISFIPSSSFPQQTFSIYFYLCDQSTTLLSIYIYIYIYIYILILMILQY